MKINSNYNYSYKHIKELFAEIFDKIAELQPALTAGDNITISDGVISATDTKYTAGSNVSISDQNVISATDTTYTAGTGISINAQNEISTDKDLTPLTYIEYNTTNDSIETSKPIIEEMIGYSASITSKLANTEVAYCGMVRNGNKLTIVIAGNCTKTVSETWNDETIVARLSLTIPSSIGAKIYPIGAGGSAQMVASTQINALYSYNTRKLLNTVTSKTSNSSLLISIYGIASETYVDNQTLGFRYEQTFLLSDNILPSL